MYNLFKFKNWKPSDFWKLDKGEKMLLNIFMNKYIEDMAKDAKKSQAMPVIQI